jgi:hypothetical protein
MNRRIPFNEVGGVIAEEERQVASHALLGLLIAYHYLEMSRN